ncbi:MAG: hypothetical protein ABI597_13740 [Gammaproteobacteria bacterium]
MQRINVSFSENVYKILEDRRQKKDQKSLAEGVRELVDLGLRIEEASEKNNQNQDEDELKKITEMLKKNLIWSMETRLLARFLVEKIPTTDKDKLIEILKKYKEKAHDHVKGLVGEDVE